MNIDAQYELLTPEQKAWFDAKVAAMAPDIEKLKEESTWLLNRARA